MISDFWPAETIIARGFATAVILTHDIASDYEDGYSMGFHKLYPEYQTNRPKNAPGTIAAWAWGASKVLDYLETDEHVNAKKVFVVGHSRGGKTALWAAASDERFAGAASSCSGCTGAALSRGNIGEKIKDINDRFPYWFCDNYKKYNDDLESMPFDQHFLLALLAPRPMYISSRTFDKWADPAGEFESCVQASQIYKLYNKVGMPQTNYPLPESPIHGGDIGYHLKTGEHNLEQYDWERYIDFFSKHV